MEIRDIAIITAEKIAVIYYRLIGDGSRFGAALPENQAELRRHSRPCPVGFYDYTKSSGELSALEENQNTFMVRTGWPHGRYGDNFVHKILQQAQSSKKIDILPNQFNTVLRPVRRCCRIG